MPDLDPTYPSVPERWILANQYEILALLEPQSAPQFRQIAEALREGFVPDFAVALERFAPTLVSPFEAGEVRRTLSMFSQLQASRAKLGDGSGISSSDLRFPGYIESHLRRWAEHLIRKLNEFPQLDFDPSLSASDVKEQTASIYTSMLAQLQVVVAEGNDPTQLDAQLIRRVLKPLEDATT